MQFERDLFIPSQKPEIAYSDKYATYIDDIYVRSIDQVYNLAKDQSIVLANGIELNDNYYLTVNDLTDIAEYQPTVNWKEYIDIRQYFSNLMNINQYVYDRKYAVNTYLFQFEHRNKIYQKYPELYAIENSITIHDAFLYAINAVNNTLRILSDKILRYKNFLEAGSMTQKLLLKLYNGEIEFINKFDNPSILEEYIFAYDQHIADYDTLMVIAYRIGIALNPDSDIAVSLYNLLNYVIENKPDEDTLKDIINSKGNNRLIIYIEKNS